MYLYAPLSGLNRNGDSSGTSTEFSVYKLAASYSKASFDSQLSQYPSVQLTENTMSSFKLLIAAAALVCVSARHIVLEDETGYYLLPVVTLEDLAGQTEEDLVPVRTERMRRQVHGSMSANSDGSSGAAVKIPLAGGDRNVLSAIGAVDFDKNHQMAGQTAGLALDNM